MTSKKHLNKQLGWAADDLAAEKRLSKDYIRMFEAQMVTSKLYRQRLTGYENKQRKQDIVEKRKIVRYFVEMTVGGELYNDTSAKSLDLINHWVKTMKLEFEDATFVITKSLTFEVNGDGRSQADIDYARAIGDFRIPYRYSPPITSVI